MSIHFEKVLIWIATLYWITAQGNFTYPTCKWVTRDWTAVVSLSRLVESDGCVQAIDITNAISVHLLFIPDQVVEKVIIQVLRQTHQEGIKTHAVVDTWVADQNDRLKIVSGQQMILLVQPVVSQSQSQLLTATRATLAYVAQLEKDVHPSCKAATLPVPQHGEIRTLGSTLGSVAEIHCSEGHVVVNGTGRATCTVKDHTLAWEGDGSICESVCKHPPVVQYATQRVHSDLAINIRTSDRGRTSARETTKQSLSGTRTTVTYMCQSPHVRVGKESLQCEDGDNVLVPQWSELPPSCIIPDCSTSPIIFRESSGALVNPSYPRDVLKGGSIICTWELIAPLTAVFRLSAHYVDLPQLPEVEIIVFDAGGPRPHQLLKLHGKAPPHQVISETSKVKVTYRGPATDVEGQFGFYLNYTVMSPESRWRRAPQATATVSTLTPQPSASSSSIGLSSASLSSASQPSASRLLTSNPPSSQTLGSLSTLSLSRSSASAPTSRTLPTSTSVQSVSGQSSGQAPTASPPTSSTNSGDGTSPKDGDSDDNWKIAVGVVIPLLLLISVLVGVYICYRKKYPVRMIIGREFGKFINPQYARPTQTPTLVRDDADDYFSNRNSMNVSTEEFNPTNSAFLYVNKAFVKDEVDDDEEERERKFLERKSWLFKKSAEENGGAEPARKREDETKQRSASAQEKASDEGTPSLEEKPRTTSVGSNSTDISEILAEQRPTPVPTRRKKNKTAKSKPDSESLSSQEQLEGDQESLETRDSLRAESEESRPKKSESTVSLSSADGITQEEPPAGLESDSQYMKDAMKLFQQPSFEEVWAESKARSRSLSVGRVPKIERPRSFSAVDHSKSARKISLHDDLVLTTAARTLAEEKKLTAAHRSQELSDLSTAVIGLDIRDLPKSLTSSVTSIDDEDHISDIPAEERERCLTMSSVNSNPHLVTDLDEELGNSVRYTDLSDEPVNESNEGIHMKDIGPSYQEPDPNQSISTTKSQHVSGSNDETTDTAPGDISQPESRMEQHDHNSSGSESNASDMNPKYEHNIDPTKGEKTQFDNEESLSDDAIADRQTGGTIVQDDGQVSNSSFLSTTAITLQPNIQREHSFTQLTNLDTAKAKGEESEERPSSVTGEGPLPQPDHDSDSDEEPIHMETLTASSGSSLQLEVPGVSEPDYVTTDPGLGHVDGDQSNSVFTEDEKELKRDGADDDPQGQEKNKVGNKKITFVLPPRERAFSDYSNTSTKGSSYSETESSDEEVKASYDFGEAASDDDTNRLHEKEPSVVAGPLITPAVDLSPSPVSGDNTDFVISTPPGETAGSKKKLVSEIQFSDSSSDTSDVAPPLPMSPPPNSALTFNSDTLDVAPPLPMSPPPSALLTSNLDTSNAEAPLPVSSQPYLDTSDVAPPLPMSSPPDTPLTFNLDTSDPAPPLPMSPPPNAPLTFSLDTSDVQLPLSLNPPPHASLNVNIGQKRIQPLKLATDADSGDDDIELTDSDISDALKESSDDEEDVDGGKMAHVLNLDDTKSSVYKFKEEDSDDDDIDV